MGRTFRVTVKPLAKVECIKQKSDNEFFVWVGAPARDGKANARLVELLAAHFGIAKSKIHIVRGHASRTKLIAIG